MVENDRLADRNLFRMVDDSKRLDTLGNRRTSRGILRSTALKDAGARTLKEWKAEKEKVTKTTKEKTHSDHSHADRAKCRCTARITARHEDLHRRPRRQWQAQKARADTHSDTKTETHAVTQTRPVRRVK